jgi:hypothetical protein
LNESCILNTVQFAISDFGFEMQDSSNFEMLLAGAIHAESEKR